MNEKIITFIRDTFQTNEFIPLHEPTFSGSELAHVTEAIKSTFVSSVGKFVDEFELKVQKYTGSHKAVAVVNGTAALHAAMHTIGVRAGDYVITQALTFVATCNTLHHMGAEPILLDVSKKSLSLSPVALGEFLDEFAELRKEGCFHKDSQRKISAVLPMHTFGHPAELDELLAVCAKWHLPLVEDAAESLGSFYKGRHTGTFGSLGVISFNGNKIITTGGGGMLLCQSAALGDKVKHITTTAKVSHPYEFYHDEAGFNYRLPNLNSALGCAQMESLLAFLAKKRDLASRYQNFFENSGYEFVIEPDYAKSNYWLNAVICPDIESRDSLLRSTNGSDIMTRPVWQLMHRLPMFKNAICDDLITSKWLEKHLVNLPSSPSWNR
ncbi:LegC family aminotransferase [Amylibacter sp.]|nr:LegC family aminotransferase [Amylibacter sp.]